MKGKKKSLRTSMIGLCRFLGSFLFCMPRLLFSEFLRFLESSALLGQLHLSSVLSIIYLFTWKAVRWERERENTVIYCFPKCLQQVRLGSTEARSKELSPGLCCRWQRLQHLSHYLWHWQEARIESWGSEMKPRLLKCGMLTSSPCLAC